MESIDKMVVEWFPGPVLFEHVKHIHWRERNRRIDVILCGKHNHVIYTGDYDGLKKFSNLEESKDLIFDYSLTSKTLIRIFVWKVKET